MRTLNIGAAVWCVAATAFADAGVQFTHSASSEGEIVYGPPTAVVEPVEPVAREPSDAGWQPSPAEPEAPPPVPSEKSGPALPSALPGEEPSSASQPSAAPAPQASSAPATSADAASAPKVAKVTLGDETVFTLSAPRGRKSADERARLASRALASATEGDVKREVHTLPQGAALQILAGDIPIVTLSPQDARLAGEESLDAYAAVVATSVEEALASEQQRGKISGRVFSASLVIFFGLVAFYLLRKTGEVAERLRDWIETQGDKLTIRVRQVELVAPEVMQTGALIALGAIKWLARLGIIYAWLLVALSMFESTRGYTERLTGWVLAPLSQLTTRFAGTLPALVIAALAVLTTWVLVRFVALLFEGVARRETTLSWVPADLARPMSVFVRLAIVLLALVFSAPIVTGDADGALARTGLVALLSLGLAATPLVAAALVGAFIVFGRRLRVNDHVQLGQKQGRVTKLGLFELCLEQVDGTELRLPYLFLAWSPLRMLGHAPRIEVLLWVDARAQLAVCEPLFQRTLQALGTEPQVELLQAQATGFQFRLSVRCQRLSQRAELLTALVAALQQAGIGLGMASTGTS